MNLQKYLYRQNLVNLTRNPSKPHALYISPTIKKATPNLKLYLNFTYLNIAKSLKYLGIIIDNKFFLDDHINYINHKVFRGVGIMTKLKHLLPILVLRNICSAFIFSNLNYEIRFNVLPFIRIYLLR